MYLFLINFGQFWLRLQITKNMPTIKFSTRTKTRDWLPYQKRVQKRSCKLASTILKLVRVLICICIFNFFALILTVIWAGRIVHMRNLLLHIQSGLDLPSTFLCFAMKFWTLLAVHAVLWKRWTILNVHSSFIFLEVMEYNVEIWEQFV